MKRRFVFFIVTVYALVVSAQAEAPDTIMQMQYNAPYWSRYYYPMPYYFDVPFLHQGLNLSLGASLTTTFGKHSLTAFSENATATYAMNLSPKLTFCAGGYLYNLQYDRGNGRNFGLYASLGYHIDDHWEAYIFAKKALITSDLPLFMLPIEAISDQIGVTLRYNFNQNTSLEVSISAMETPEMRHKSNIRAH